MHCLIEDCVLKSAVKETIFCRSFIVLLVYSLLILTTILLQILQTEDIKLLKTIVFKLLPI